MQIQPAILIYLIVPLIGLGAFLWLRHKMLKAGADIYLTIEYLLIFVTYGGLLLVVLTTLFWYWSGLASIGSIYLVLVAPIVMCVIAYRNALRTKESAYHFWAHRLAILFFLIAPIVIVLLYWVVDSVVKNSTKLEF